MALYLVEVYIQEHANPMQKTANSKPAFAKSVRKLLLLTVPPFWKMRGYRGYVLF